MATYIVAVKREHRSDVPEDWIERLRETPGVELNVPADAFSGARSGAVPDETSAAVPDRAIDAVHDEAPERRRVRIRATASGIAALRARVGTFCHVEPLIEHRGTTDVDES